MIEYKVITLPLAEEDIADQTDYIAFELKSPETAVNMVRGFRKIIKAFKLSSLKAFIMMIMYNGTNIYFYPQYGITN
ncbi:hypothetical protein C804_01497 [Lachnospiraceae bacterium A4]|nr:hypothetical protein C804_01497 [Lachnospiraceae bacterium A4]